ncbi:tRNA (guanosine(37)-N1)-methyltransferase TrmD [Gorillibacterium sp. sgz500922]|uniref:tRNA (guanosine(37)-N1)-methyltransferase TrmD n=1 Tax=Gorillibacterium sp. sgz500922 TaxID=3446694 RepID=UPI003F670CB4
MRMDVLTLFPEMFDGVFGSSILGKAREKGLVRLNAVNFRRYSTNKHNTVDDYPFGGGGGMVLKPEPIFAAVEDLLADAAAERTVGAGSGEASGGIVDIGLEGAPDNESAAAVPSSTGKPPRVILLCPQGEPYTQKKAEEFAAEDHLIFICGHYEGYDERIREHLVTDELSIGDYVLTGGELPAMVVIDSVVRLLPGALGNESSAVTDSFSTGLLEYPHYTRPASFRDWSVPEVLISGHHGNIEAWRREQSLRRTWERRPDLLADAGLTAKEKRLIEEWERHAREAEPGAGE